MRTASERLERFAAFDRAYRDKAAPEPDDIDADSPADNEPIHTCAGCSFPVLDSFATAEIVAGRETTHWCPRCIRGGKLRGAA